MSSNICGNCENFKPKKSERFFNCTAAKHAGVSYGMQVRADTRACDAFALYKVVSPTPSSSTPSPQKPAARTIRKQTDDRKRPTGLCPWGRGIIIAAIVIAILIIGGLAYMCSSNLLSSPEATPTPTPTPTFTLPPGATPEPTPTPIPYILEYFEIGQDSWAMTETKWILVYSAVRTNINMTSLQSGEYAPPGTDFLIVDVTFFNKGSSAVQISTDEFTLIDSSGYTYPATKGTYYIVYTYDAVVLPGKSYTGRMIYVVPKPATGLELSYFLDQYSAPKVIARWKIAE